jgi:hypothetical protein
MFVRRSHLESDPVDLFLFSFLCLLEQPTLTVGIQPHIQYNFILSLSMTLPLLKSQGFEVIPAPCPIELKSRALLAQVQLRVGAFDNDPRDVSLFKISDATTPDQDCVHPVSPVWAADGRHWTVVCGGLEKR